MDDERALELVHTKYLYALKAALQKTSSQRKSKAKESEVDEEGSCNRGRSVFEVMFCWCLTDICIAHWGIPYSCHRELIFLNRISSFYKCRGTRMHSAVPKWKDFLHGRRQKEIRERARFWNRCTYGSQIRLPLI